MIVTCEKCGSGYELEISAIGPNGRMVKCSNCAHVWRQFLKEEETVKKPPVENNPAPEEASFNKRIYKDTKVPITTMAANQAQIGLLPKFLFVTLILLNILLGAFVYGGRFLANHPSLAKIEARVRTNTSKGVELQNISYKKMPSEEKLVTLLVNGEIVNTTAEMRKIPKVMISFMDKNGKKIFSHEYPVDKTTLEPAERIPFEPKISDIPTDKVASVYLDIGSKYELLTR